MTKPAVVVVGAGVAAVRFVEQLRQRGFEGSVTVIGAEVHRPYDRPPLSKQVLRGERDSTTFPDLDSPDVRWVLGTRATALDIDRCMVLTAGGGEFGYDTLVLAPGGRPRSLPGLEVGPGIHVLRTIDDALRLRASLAVNQRVIVLGGGFIGCEIAASVRTLGYDVDMVEALAAPLVRVLGAVGASKVRDLHEAHGARLHLGVRVDQVLRDAQGGMAGLELDDGTLLEGRDVVVGIGITADVAWLEGSGLEIGDGIVCDGTGRTSVANVYALGDAAQWWHPLVGEHRRIEHWTTTADQAGVVAAAVAGDGVEDAAELSAAPYFWSDQYDLKIQGVGFVDPDDEVHELSVSDRSVLLYARDGIVRGVVGFSIPGAVMRTKPLIERRAPVTDAIGMLTP